MLDLTTHLGPLKLKNPVLVSSGTFGYGEEFSDFFDLNLLGGIVTKTITCEERIGNSSPRIIETSSGLLNSIGLANVGVDKFIKEKLPFLVDMADTEVCPYTAIIVSIAGTTDKEYVKLSKLLSNEDSIDALEINISCPNIKEGGITFGTSPDLTEKLVSNIKKSTNLPIITKLTPNVTDITEIAKAAINGGTDIISLVNTYRGMAIDVKTRQPKLGNIYGGLSGPAIKPLALACVYQVASKFPHIPIIGMGGIMNWEDALEFIFAGATAISIGTANFINPRSAVDVLNGIIKYCETSNIVDFKTLLGFRAA